MNTNTKTHLFLVCNSEAFVFIKDHRLMYKLANLYLQEFGDAPEGFVRTWHGLSLEEDILSARIAIKASSRNYWDVIEEERLDRIEFIVRNELPGFENLINQMSDYASDLPF